MNMTKTELLYQQADEDLKRATQELYRPSSDVVSFSACVYSRRALYKFLNGLAHLYASEKKIILEPELTIDQLITFCSQFNKKLKQIDFSSLDCKCNKVLKDGEEEIIFCTSVNRVGYCANLAESVRVILEEKMHNESL
jgi:hypothetical protein